MEIVAYNMKAKEKQPMTNAVIDKNGNRYFAKGLSAKGDKMSVAMGADKANEAIKKKVATKGKGWD